MKLHSHLSGILLGGGLLLAPQAAWSANPNTNSLDVLNVVPSSTIDTIHGSAPKSSDRMTVSMRIPDIRNDIHPTSEVTQPSARETLLTAESDSKLSSDWKFAPAKLVAQTEAPPVLFPNAQTSVTNTNPVPQSGSLPPLGETRGLNTNPSVQILNTPPVQVTLPSLTQSGGIPNNISPSQGVPPTLPRAVPPPVGDISISNFGATFSSIDLGTSQRIPRLILRDAPVREVLGILARSAGMNVVFTNEGATKDPLQAVAAPGATPDKEGPKISLDIENESIQDVFNYVLRVGGLQANRSGRTIFVGARLPVEAQNIIIRTLRLNQVTSTIASTYLSTLGAETRQFIQTKKLITVGDGAAARVAEEFGPPQVVTVPVTEGKGPLPLQGLSVSVDARLNTITLLGDPQKVSIATTLLTQLDGRKRQVMVNVKIVDINLDNIQSQNSSFSFKVGQNFFSVDSGAALYNFGPSRPPTNTEAQASNFYVYPVVTGISVPSAGFFDNNPNANFNNTGTTSLSGSSFYSRPAFGTSTNPFQSGVSQVQSGQVTIQAPTLYQFPSQFLSQIQAQITSRNAKILTDPSLIVQEGQTATVALTQQVLGNVTSTTTTTGSNSTTQTVTANIVNAGLELNVNVDRIDDNGFVTLTVNPKVTSLGNTVNLTLGTGNVNTIQLLNTRSVSSGQLRLRDGQTLVLSGIIQDQDQTTVSKVPLLGDLPIIGTLFRKTSKDHQRQEVIVLLTPQVLDDSDRASFGYGYNPSNEVQKALNNP